MKEYKAVERYELSADHPEFEAALAHIEEVSQDDYSDITHVRVSTIDHIIENAIEYEEEELVEQLIDFNKFLTARGINLIFWNI